MFLGVREDQRIHSRKPYHLDTYYFMAIFIFWVGWDLVSPLQKEVPACLLPRPFPGHWHSAISAPWYLPRPMMAVAGIAPSCVPWTMQLFGRVMLTESKKHLILHLSMWVYCIVQSHREYKGHSCSVKCGLCSDYLTRMKFLPSFFLSQTLTLTLKRFLTVAFVFPFTHWNTGRETLDFAWESLQSTLMQLAKGIAYELWKGYLWSFLITVFVLSSLEAFNPIFYWNF